MPSPERARPPGLSQLLTVTANCPRGAWPDALAARELGPGSALDCLQPSPTRQKFVPHDPMPRARLPRRPCPHACHARATRRAHHGTSPAPITLVPAPIMMAAVTLRYPARPLPRYPAQTTVLDSSGPDVGLEWHPHPSAPRHAAAHDSDRLHTCRPGDLAGGPRSPPDTTTTRFSLSAPILSPLRPFLRWPGPALGLSPLHNRDPAVTGPGLARARGKSMHPDRALRAPTQDSDRHPRYSAPRHAVVHGSAQPYTHRLGDRDCGSSTTAR